MKRLVAILAACTMLVCAAASCGSSSSGGGSSAKSSASSDELSGKYFCCNKEGESYGLCTFEFDGNKFQMQAPGAGGSLADYISGTFETDGDKITLHLNKLTKEQLAAMNGESPDEYPDPYVDEANERARKMFEGTYDYNVFDGNLIYISAVEEMVHSVAETVDSNKQKKANSACSSIRRAVECAYVDAEEANKLPARTKKSQPIIYSSDAAKTLNCDGLNDVFHDMIVNYYEDADQYDYIVVIGKDGFVELAACCKKGDKYVGLYPPSGNYNGTNVSAMTLDEIYELVSK